MLLIVLCIFLSASSSLQQESCKYKVALLQSKTVSCFRKMKDTNPCNKENPNCISEIRNDLMCIKWSGADVTCRNIDLNEVPIGNVTCAEDQESLNCTREFPTSPTPEVASASSVSMYCRGGYILLLFIVSAFLF